MRYRLVSKLNIILHAIPKRIYLIKSTCHRFPVYGADCRLVRLSISSILIYCVSIVQIDIHVT